MMSRMIFPSAMYRLFTTSLTTAEHLFSVHSVVLLVAKDALYVEEYSITVDNQFKVYGVMLHHGTRVSILLKRRNAVIQQRVILACTLIVL